MRSILIAMIHFRKVSRIYIYHGQEKEHKKTTPPAAEEEAGRTYPPREGRKTEAERGKAPH